jgi:hypothetical protein
MATLVQLQARLDALDVAIDSGVLTVRHGETSTTFRAMSEMLTARNKLLKQIAAAGGSKASGPKYIYQSGKGL